MRRIVIAFGALALALWSLWVLEGARDGIAMIELRNGQTPVTRMSDGRGGPPVVIAHGFAGSRQMMQAYGLTLARAGYVVYSFDFEGHGRHPSPMRGDVSSIDGTTRHLVDQTRRVISMARQNDRGPVALLGHSMASDVLVRAAEVTEGIGPIVLLSGFSRAITATHPADLLLVAGEWEPGLAEFAGKALRMADPTARMGQTVDTENGNRRRAVLAPAVEHVAILHSRVAQRAALAWIDGFHGRDSRVRVPATGWALLTLLAAITVLFAPVAGLLPRSAVPEGILPPGRFAVVTLIPAVVAPLLAVPVDTRLLPVLVADYLALHLGFYGILQGALLWLSGRRPGALVPLAAGLLVVWGLGVFGVALDRYGTNFVPVNARVWIILALCLGAVPFMLADSWLALGGPLWQRLTARLAFLGSLAAAVALDPERLFFLVMIAPVIVLFYLTFGAMGRVSAARSGPLAAGFGLGLVLAWALGVAFPMIAT